MGSPDRRERTEALAWLRDAAWLGFVPEPVLVTLTGESERVVAVVGAAWDRSGEWASEPLCPSGGRAAHWLSTWSLMRILPCVIFSR